MVIITMLQTEQLQTLQAIILFTNKFIDIIFNIFRCQSSMAMQFSIVIELFLCRFIEIYRKIKRISET